MRAKKAAILEAKSGTNIFIFRKVRARYIYISQNCRPKINILVPDFELLFAKSGPNIFIFRKNIVKTD